MKLSCIVIVMSLLACIGCDKAIYIPIDEGELKIVVSSIINPDSSIVAAISSSKQLIEPNPYALPPDSMIIDHIGLFENNQFVGYLEYLDRVFYTLPGFKPSTGKTYRIKISSKERTTVQAVTTIPDLIPITFFNTTLIKVNEDESNLDVNLEISDPANQVDFYALEVSGLQNFWDWHQQQYTDSLVIRPYFPKVNGKADEFIDLFFLM